MAIGSLMEALRLNLYVKAAKGQKPKAKSQKQKNMAESRRKQLFPEVTDEQWNDWKWQVKNRIETLDELKKAYPQKVDGKLDDWQRLFAIPDSLKAKVNNATTGVYFVYNSNDQGATLLKVGDKKAPQMFYTLATVTYEAYASTKTSENLRDRFQEFLNKNKTAKAFTENAAKAD